MRSGWSSFTVPTTPPDDRHDRDADEREGGHHVPKPRPAGPGAGVYAVDTRTRAVGGPANTSDVYPVSTEGVRRLRQEQVVRSPPRGEVREPAAPAVREPVVPAVPASPPRSDPAAPAGLEQPQSPDRSVGDAWEDAAVDSGFEDEDLFEEELPEGFSDQEADETVAQVGAQQSNAAVANPADTPADASNPTAEFDAHAEDAGDMSDDSQKRPHLTIQTDLANEAKDADVSNVEAVQGQTTTSSG